MFKKKAIIITTFVFTLLVGLQLTSSIDVQAGTDMGAAKTVVTGKSDQSFSDAVKAEKGQVSAPTPEEKLSGGSAAARAPFAETKVEKATGENGYTVAEIFAKGKELNGKTVRVRGRVVRYNPAIMGKNWIHIQDGTGDPMRNTHDLVATSTETATVGEVITVEGKLAADKDFGAGYTYTVIIEEAKLIK